MEQAKIRGKDLIGGVKVMPMGLDAAIKKRTSGEFKMEQKGGSMSFSEANQSSSMQQMESRQLATFKEESNESLSFNQTQNTMNTSSMKASSSMKSSFQSSNQSSSREQVSSSNQSSSMSMSSSKTMTSSSSFQSGFTQENQISNMDSKLIENQQQEIQQDNLKTQIVSAITDLECDREFVDFGKENKPIELLTSPAQKSSPPPVASSFTPTKQDPFSPSKQEMFSPPPLERFEPPQPQQPLPATNGGDVGPQPQPSNIVPTRNGLQNGFNEFVSSKNVEVEQIHEFSQSQTTQINGTYEESGSIQGSNSSNSILQKIMTPASAEFESGSLKRRDPKKMFTDSSFYNSKYHPTIADQVEMAHKLSSAMFTEQNKASKGAKMYLTRMENSGGFQDKETAPKHDTVPNMKLVMNPEGKVTDWDDLAPDQRPDYNQVAGHAAPGAPSLSLPEVADPVAESLNAGVGKGGELFAKRKKKAESWIVDDNSIGRAQPSAFADHFIKEQTQQQLAFQQEKQVEQQQKKQIFQQEAAVKEAEQLQQQQEAKQAFMQQQQFKQEQSMEIRKIQEMAQQQPDFPQDFQHTSLKARSFTPSLDLSCHNVQGINVWANTAPRGWSNTYTRSKATPTRGSAAPPSADNQMMASMEQEQQLRVQQQEEQLRIQQEEQFRIRQEQQLMIQQEEQLRIQQEEQFRIQQEQQMRIQQEQQLRIQQEEEQKRLQFEQEEMARKQEEEMRRQAEERMRQEQEMRLREEEEIRRQEEMRLQEERRRQEEQMRIQMQQQEEQRRLQEEQMRIQQQQEESMRIQMQQEEQYRMQAQQEEQYRMQAQQEEQYRMQAQKEEQMRVEMQQQELMQQQQKKATKTQVSDDDVDLEAQKRREYEEWFKLQEKEALEYSASVKYHEKIGESEDLTDNNQLIAEQQQQNFTSTETKVKTGFSYGVKQADISHIGPKDAQLAMPPMSSSVFESSQSQTFSSVQESSTSFSQSSHSTNQIYESQEFNGGVMKGYKAKEEFSSEQSQNGEGRNVRDSGIFTGINGDSNALVDEEFDRKKHTVKDLAKHFALVKPKQNIPHNILPEQKMYNGDHGPALNYLGASEGGLVQSQARREMSQQDVEASKAAYEMKKKQQLEQQQSSTTTTTTASSSSTVVKRMESSSSSEQQQKSERRMSLRDSLMLDPAQAHADAGIIDPSAILRGSEGADGRATSEGILNQSTVQGETDKILNKWDNHNTIARGWAGVEANYHPVTFRKMYNVDNQKQTVAL